MSARVKGRRPAWQRLAIWAAGALSVMGAVAVVSGLFWWQGSDGVPRIDPSDQAQVNLGKRIYDRHCAACHGVGLEGQPDWQQRRPNGRLPAPPHDETGHTWHHPDRVLFGVTKYGLVPPYAPPDYETDMPAFKDTLSDDEIAASLAYIMSTWPPEALNTQRQIDRQDRERR